MLNFDEILSECRDNNYFQKNENIVEICRSCCHISGNFPRISETNKITSIHDSIRFFNSPPSKEQAHRGEGAQHGADAPAGPFRDSGFSRARSPDLLRQTCSGVLLERLDRSRFLRVNSTKYSYILVILVLQHFAESTRIYKTCIRLLRRHRSKPKEQEGAICTI